MEIWRRFLCRLLEVKTKMLNPILRREVQTSLRSWKIFGVIAAYVGVITFFTIVFIKTAMSGSLYSGFDPKSIIYLYALLSGLQFGLILITAPALTAGSISGERERQTLDLLIVTRMSPFSIVFGKLLSSIGLIMLMIIAAMPVYAVLFYFGGVSILYLFGMTVFMLVTACMVGSMGIFFSAIYKKTMVSMVLVYLIIGILVVGTLVGYLSYSNIYIQAYKQIYDYISLPAVYGFFFLNPAAGFFSTVDAQLGTNFFDEITMTYWIGNGLNLPVEMWIVNMVSDILVSGLFLKLASLKINPAKK